MIIDIINNLSKDAMNFLLYYNRLLPKGNPPQDLSTQQVDPNEQYEELEKKFADIQSKDFKSEVYPKIKLGMYVMARAAIETCVQWLSPHSKFIDGTSTASEKDLVWDLSNLDVINKDFANPGTPPPVVRFYEVDTNSGDITMSLPKRDALPDRTITFLHAGGGNDVIIEDDGGSTVQTLTSQGSTVTLYPGTNQWISVN